MGNRGNHSLTSLLVWSDPTKELLKIELLIVHAGNDRKHNVVPMLTPVYHQKHPLGWKLEHGRKWSGLVFFYNHVFFYSHVHHFPEEENVSWCTMGRKQDVVWCTGWCEMRWVMWEWELFLYILEHTSWLKEWTACVYPHLILPLPLHLSELNLTKRLRDASC